MEADRHRHRLDAQIIDARPHLQGAVFETVRDCECVRERELLHPFRMAVEIERTSGPGGPRISLRFFEAPVARIGEEAVDGNHAANVSELHVEVVFPAVREERLLIEAVREWREQWDSVESGPGAEFRHVPERPANHLLTLDAYLVCIA